MRNVPGIGQRSREGVAVSLRRVVFALIVSLSLGAWVGAIRPASVDAATVCYWSGDVVRSEPVNVPPNWTMKVTWRYGYDCYGQLVKVKIKQVHVIIDFYNGGNYNPNETHYETWAGLFAWDPASTYNEPLWKATGDHSCTGGCKLDLEWYPNVTGLTYDASVYARFGGSGHGFYDSLFLVDCQNCGENGGGIFMTGKYNFPRDTMTVNGEYPPPV